MGHPASQLMWHRQIQLNEQLSGEVILLWGITMADAGPWSSLLRSWVHVQLPGYRELPGYTTYQGFHFENLPPIPIFLDDDCEWLMEHGTPHNDDGLNHYDSASSLLPPAKVLELARGSNIELPRSFCRFINTPELQSRVRSCTLCYLDPGERVLETVGSVPGHLIHFLSDSQSCAHWYLHILPSGASAVLESPDLYCYSIENSEWIDNPASRLDCLDLAGSEFVYCAPTFSEFLYRFWIENEIWFALKVEGCRRPLNSLELDYVSHYAS